MVKSNPFNSIHAFSHWWQNKNLGGRTSHWEFAKTNKNGSSLYPLHLVPLYIHSDISDIMLHSIFTQPYNLLVKYLVDDKP